MNNKQNTLDRLRTAVGKKQLIAIAVVLLLGGLGTVAILRMGETPAGGEEGHEHGHEEAKGHGDDEHHEKGEAAKGNKEGAAEEAHTEGAVTMTAEQIKAAGVSLETAGPATIRSALQLPGEIAFNDDRTAHVVPRVGGVVEAVPVSLGQQVTKGQVLAVISSSGVSDHRAELQSAQKRLQLARTTYEREKQLFEQRISPQQDVQQAEQAMREVLAPI
ncbi:MAG: biotin/lipoyl-binding protein [Roseateles sp.]|nr:MAG: biotin/lipoyl-binding protein [Roseateles sp.]